MKNDIIFDFDGVIANTRDILFALFREFDSTISDEDFGAHFDGNVYEEPRIKFTREAAAHMHNEYCNRLSIGHVETAIAPVKRLQANHRLFIISSGEERGIKSVLENAGIKDHFEAIYGHNTHTSKIAKFEKIRDEFDVVLKDVIFVTDTLGDVREAKTLGVKTIAETFGFHNRARLKQGAPYVILDTWLEIENEIEKSHYGSQQLNC